LLYRQSSLGAPLPYAFNYHYENNQFRGLAFANFRQPFEADSVVAALNGYDLFGRKLRVEYKKVLQIGEKERIEKEKAIRRMKSAQLNRGGGTGNTTPNSANHSSFASQQRPGFNGVPAMPSFNLARAGGQGWHSRNLDNDSSNPAAYVSQYGRHPEDANRNSIFENSFQKNTRDQSSQSDSPPSSANLAEHPSSNSDFFAKEQEQPVRVDHTDPWTFDMHTKLVMFMADRTTAETTFSSNLSPREKKIIHALAERLGLQHSDAEGRVVIGKVANPAPIQPVSSRFYLFATRD
jgi:RNA recognition motif-containing protein